MSARRRTEVPTSTMVRGEPAPGTSAAPARLPRRLGREQRTVELMIRLYCGAHHESARSGGLCSSCEALLKYSDKRVEACRFGAQKPVCANCTVHCYRPQMREEIRAVMRYSGPRMLRRHPYLAIRHLLDRCSPTPTT